MSDAPNLLKTVITQAGIDAVFDASNQGMQAKIVEVGLGAAHYTPALNADGHATATELQDERERFPVQDAKRVSPSQIDLSFIAESANEYWLREIGFFLEDGTLFAVWSHEEKKVTWKSELVPLVMGFELALSALPADSVTVVASGAPLELLMTGETLSLSTSILNLQNEQLRQADRIREIDGKY